MGKEYNLRNIVGNHLGRTAPVCAGNVRGHILNLGIFETQRKSDWVQKMLIGAGSTFGHQDVTWRKRALLAFPEAGIEGMSLTSIEIERGVSHLIGMANNKESRSHMIRIGLKAGIIEPTDRPHRKVEGVRTRMPIFKITGHMEIHENSLIPVLME